MSKAVPTSRAALNQKPICHIIRLDGGLFLTPSIVRARNTNPFMKSSEPGFRVSS